MSDPLCCHAAFADNMNCYQLQSKSLVDWKISVASHHKSVCGHHICSSPTVSIEAFIMLKSKSKLLDVWSKKSWYSKAGLWRKQIFVKLLIVLVIT